MKSKNTILSSIIAVGIVSSGMSFYALSINSDTSEIRNISKTEIGNWRYFVHFEFCTNIQNSALGIWAKTDLEKIPIPINPDGKISECQKLAVKIRADNATSLTMSTFSSEDLPKLIKEVEELRQKTLNELVKAEQYLLKLQNQQSSVEEIEEAKDRRNVFKEILESTSESLKTLRSMR